MPDLTLDEFRAEAIAFLDANAERRDTEQRFVWGEGDDAMTLFEEVDPETERRELERAKAWRAKRFDAGLGYISGPEQYGGRGLPSAYDRAYAQLEAKYAKAIEALGASEQVAQWRKETR